MCHVDSNIPGRQYAERSSNGMNGSDGSRRGWTSSMTSSIRIMPHWYIFMAASKYLGLSYVIGMSAL